ncbi:hypothetical protein BDF14DRAFT_662639 [Spinellus fusiger]|nr:hypothetical protein BDF14DRAFT_662639 [Spinellus fusiger]
MKTGVWNRIANKSSLSASLSASLPRSLPREYSILEESVPRLSSTLVVAAPTHLSNHNNKTGESNFKVLMVKRNPKGTFNNSHVFPGGMVDRFDHFSHWESHFPIPTEQEKKDILTSKLCAIRETFEECGLLLTHPPASTVVLDTDIEMWRKKVHADASQFKIMCNHYHILPAVDALFPFSHWITPTHLHKRFTTLFFLTVLQDTFVDHQDMAHVTSDSQETVCLDWFTPEQGSCKM